MKRILSVIAGACLLFAFASMMPVEYHASSKEPDKRAVDVAKALKKFPRGLTKTPRFKLVSARRFDRTGIKVPSQIVMLPQQLSMWGNSQYGDCVSASEAARIAAWSVFCGLPETFIPEATVISWAQAGNYLNGANLTDVMTDRQTRGMGDASGKLYTAGPYTTVDFTDEATLQAALATGPVNLGIDANALPSGAGNNPAWYSFGGSPGQFSNEDHCVPLLGFGPTTVLFQQLSTVYGVNVTPPAGAPASGYLLFTWNTVGVVDHAWLMSTAGEAWVQNPTTIGQTPGPTPPPNPPGPPNPPTPGGATFTLSAPLQAGTYEISPSGTAAAIADLDAAIAKWKALQGSNGKVMPKATNADARLDRLESIVGDLVKSNIALSKALLGKKE